MAIFRISPNFIKNLFIENIFLFDDEKNVSWSSTKSVSFLQRRTTANLSRLICDGCGKMGIGKNKYTRETVVLALRFTQSIFFREDGCDTHTDQPPGVFGRCQKKKRSRKFRKRIGNLYLHRNTEIDENCLF